MEQKPVYKSLTMAGVAVTALSVLVRQLDIEASDEELQALVDGASAVGVWLGMLVSIIGRLKANTKVVLPGRGVPPMLLPLLLCALMVSCAPSWKKDAVTGYEAAGKALAAVHEVAMVYCHDTLPSPPPPCDKLREKYEEARRYYLSAGDALILTIDASDSVERAAADREYLRAMGELATMIPEAVRLAEEVRR